ncbi:carbon storage regulator CsrA [bacterium]|nr:carbon storage regulator CsrA [bacterium]
MLYLARKVGESIIINNNVELTVMEVKGKSVKLGFRFPPDVSVLRKELYDRIIAENREAATGGEINLDDLL